MTPKLDLATPLGRSVWAGKLLGPLDDEKFDDLAQRLFAFQFGHVPAYRRLCVAHGVTPESITSWKEIPAMPQQVFKHEKLFAHGKARAAAIYETSGTTTGQPGRQHLLATDIYRWVAVAGAQLAGLFEHKPRLEFFAFAPADAPHSSLSAMFDFWREKFSPKGRYWFRKNPFAPGLAAPHSSLDSKGLREALEALIRDGRPVGLCGAALGFAAWITPMPLPPGSFLLETGGFKGRTREIPKADLYARLSKLFSVPDEGIWNEYGMSELSSQAYARGANGLHRTPPWARVLVVNPATGREVRLGEKGLVRWIDLANVDSVLAVQTLDLAESAKDGFRLIGRMARSEPRGCSLGYEDLRAHREVSA
jgi:hypothetical protein